MSLTHVELLLPEKVNEFLKLLVHDIEPKDKFDPSRGSPFVVIT